MVTKSTPCAAPAADVFAYNYTDDAFGASYPNGPEAGINAAHYTTPHLELLEGNYSFNFTGDTYWGNSIYITAFRNWISGLRAAHPPLNTYSYPLSCGPLPYGDYVERNAVKVQAYSYYTNFIGNVLGMNGQALLDYTYHVCFNGIQNGFVTQVTMASDWDTYDYLGSGGVYNYVTMLLIGSYQATVNSTGNWTFVPTTIDTQTRTANWDWVTAAEHCYTYGTTTDAGCSGVTVPNSFYFTSKPAFFGSQTWPWVYPTTGVTYTLPAMYCFQHNEMPTCLQ